MRFNYKFENKKGMSHYKYVERSPIYKTMTHEDWGNCDKYLYLLKDGEIIDTRMYNIAKRPGKAECLIAMQIERWEKEYQ